MRLRLKPILMTIVGTAIVVPTLLPAQNDAAIEHTLGNHPAVIIFKKWTQPNYISTTAIYPHPASISWFMHDPNARNLAVPVVPGR